MESKIRRVAPTATYPADRVVRKDPRRDDDSPAGRAFAEELAREAGAAPDDQPEPERPEASGHENHHHADDEPGAQLDLLA